MTTQGLSLSKVAGLRCLTNRCGEAPIICDFLEILQVLALRSPKSFIDDIVRVIVTELQTLILTPTAVGL